MKYVFYDIFYAASAPKAAADIIAYMKGSVGSEMLTGYMEKYVAGIRQMVKEANEKRKMQMMVDYTNQVNWNHGRRSGTIRVYKHAPYGYNDIARLYFVEVDSMWAESSDGVLRQFTFSEWDRLKMRVANNIHPDKVDEILRKMVSDLKNGVPVEEVADKYVTFATPELRKKLIDGMKAFVEKGGNV